MEATAIFDGATYSVEFAVHIGAVGVRRMRRASESGTFSIEGGVMNLASNNGSNLEVWGKVAGLVGGSDGGGRRASRVP